jgi:hypothetical protein
MVWHDDSTILAVLDAVALSRVRQALANVAEASDLQGRQRHAPDTLRDLRWMILGHDHRPALHQLCYLYLIADSLGDRADRQFSFFWGRDVRFGGAWKVGLAQLLADEGWCREGLMFDDEGIVLGSATDGFKLYYGRLPILAALLDFLIEMVPFGEIEQVLTPMCQGALDKARIGEAANRLSQLVDAALKPGDDEEAEEARVATAHQVAKHRVLANHFQKRTGRQGLEVDDAGLLDFWCDRTDAAEAGDYRRYTTVYDDVYRLLWALDAAVDRRGIAGAAGIGGDRDAGEVDPGDVGAQRGFASTTEQLEDLAGWVSPLSGLDDDAARELNILFKSQRSRLGRLMCAGPTLRDLPLSLLRAECYGATQAQLTQADRDGDALDNYIACRATERYRDWLMSMDEIDAHCEATVLAIAAVLARTAAGSDEDGKTVVSLFSKGENHELLDRAEAAFRQVNRKGFREGAFGPTEGYLIGLGVLIAVRKQIQALKAVAKAIDAQMPDIDGCFEHDRSVFSVTFQRLQGDMS